jgi:hypothetical protein
MQVSIGYLKWKLVSEKELVPFSTSAMRAVKTKLALKKSADLKAKEGF